MNQVLSDLASQQIGQIEAALAEHREVLLRHPVYDRIGDPHDMRRFMEHHVFAVWDFMSLLKALQRSLTCVDVPWVPNDNPLGRRLINEIVLAEESDEDGRGGYLSHFELYLEAMRHMGASGVYIERFLTQIRQGQDVTTALHAVDLPRSITRFVQNTFDLIATGNLAAIASGFTFGREDLLPAVFQKLVDGINQQTNGAASTFVYYLERHIELDGDSHGPMAHRLLSHLCGEDLAEWEAAQQAAIRSLEARRLLWDGMLQEIS